MPPAIVLEITRGKPAVTVHPVNRAHASKAALPVRSSVTVNALFLARTTNIVAPLAIVKATIKDRLAVTVHHANRAHASRDVLPVRYSATANASPRARITNIAAPPAIVKATTRAKLAATVHPANRVHASRDAWQVRYFVTVSVLFLARTTNIVVPLAIVKATIKDRLAVMAPRARAVYASRDALQDRFCVMANASPRPRIICIAVLRAIVKATTRDRLVVTVHPANRAHASRDALPVRFSVTVNASSLARITNIAAHRATAKEITRARLAVTVHPVNKALANRDVLLDKFCAMANASPRPQTIYIAVLRVIAKATTRVRLAVTVRRANRAHASRDALPVRSSVTVNASPQEPITNSAVLRVTA